MQPGPPPEFAREFFSQLKEECIPRIEKATVPFFGIQDEQIKRDRTRVLYKVGGHHFILTAAHNLRAIIQNEIPLYIDRSDDKTLPIPIVDAVFHTTEEDHRDVAAIRLPDDVVKHLCKNKEFLTHCDTRSPGGDSDCLYVFFGYPMDWFEGATESSLVSTPLAYYCRRYDGRKNPHGHFDPDLHIALGFTRRAVNMTKERIDELPSPKGISGCGIWQVAEWSREGFERWEPRNTYLTALQHHWSQERDYVIGTWIEHALALIKKEYPDVGPAMDLVYPRPR